MSTVAAPPPGAPGAMRRAADTSAPRASVRVALVLDEGPWLGWHADVADALAEAGACIVAIERMPVPPRTPASRTTRWLEALDRRVADALRPSLRRLEAPAPLHASSAFGDAAPRAGDVARGGEPVAPDLVLWLASAPPDAASTRRARHGLLSLRSPLDRTSAVDGWGRVSVALAREVTIVRLVQHDADGTERPWRERAFDTDVRSWSLNRRYALAAAAALVHDAIAHGALAHGPAIACGADDAAVPPPQPVSHGLRTLLAIERRAASRTWRDVRQRLRRDRRQWLPMLHEATAHGAVTWVAGPLDTRAFRPVVPPAGVWWADPFPLVDREGRLHVAVEELPPGSDVAHIALLSRDDAGRWTSQPIIRSARHLSYPFVFRDRDACYIVPESARDGHIACWRMGEHTHDWKLDTVLMDGVQARDTSIVLHEGRYWMFTGLRRSGRVDGVPELHLFYASSFPSTQWTPHPLNPVVCDARYARMAGGFVRDARGLLRIAQSYVDRTYGGRIELRRIERLDPEGYRESPAGRILPDAFAGALATHHLASDGRHTVVDVLRPDPRRREGTSARSTPTHDAVRRPT